MSDFPPNSFSGKGEPEPDNKQATPEEKNVEQVTSAAAKRRKKPMHKRLSEMLVGGSAKSASNYVVFDVLVPAAKEMIVDAGSTLIERTIFGDSRRRRGSTPPIGGPTGYVSYNRYSMAPQQPEAPRMSRRARAMHNFDEIVLASRPEANDVLEMMFELVSRHEAATVADLYTMVGLASTHVDTTWGWTDLRGSDITKVRGGGYLLDLPEPKHL